MGNTVIVVEHDDDIMRSADEIIDLGPDAGVLCGEVVAQGTFQEILKAETWTGKYLSKRAQIEIPEKRIKLKKFVHIKGAREHNLKP